MEENQLELIVGAYEDERKLFNVILESLSKFIETYQGIKSSLLNLQGENEKKLPDQLEELSNTLVNTRKVVLACEEKTNKHLSTSNDVYNKLNDVENNLKNTVELITKLNSNYNSFVSLQEEAFSCITRLNEAFNNMKNINFDELEGNLEKYASNLESLNNSVKQKIESNTDKLKEMEKSVEKLTRETKTQNEYLGKILESVVATNEFVDRIVQKNTVDEQYLYDVLDNWARDRKIKMKKG